MNNVEPYEITDVERGNKFEVRGGIQGCFRQGHIKLFRNVQSQYIKFKLLEGEYLVLWHLLNRISPTNFL
jgi:hypothetical protein